MRRCVSTVAAVLTLGSSACAATQGGPLMGGIKPILIGASVSLNGDFAADGRALEQGYQLWADDVNAKGGLLGRRVQLDFMNDDSIADQAAKNYQNLIRRDHVDLTFGPFSSTLTIPSSVVTNRAGYAFPEPAGGGPDVFNRGLSNIFFVQPAPVVDNLVSYVHWVLALTPDQRPRTAAYATEDDPFTQPQIDRARGLLEAGGVQTVYTKVYPADSKDYITTGLALVKAHADVVVLGTQVTDGIAFIRILEQQHYSPRSLIETAGPDQGAEFADMVGTANTEGILVPAGWWPNAKTNLNDHFVKTFLSNFGGDAASISADAAEAYSVGQVVEQAVNQIGTIDNGRLIEALHSGTYQTIQGPLSFDKTGSPSGASFLIQWQNGQAVPVYPPQVATAKPEYPKPTWQ
jgi:branched-chain amino acid transport system substrate-binding protein